MVPLCYLLHHCKGGICYQGRRGARGLSMADVVPLQNGGTHTDSVLAAAEVAAAACDTHYYCYCYAIVVGSLAA